jgi:glycosyltransferase involved in cell wall biosynthesis
MRAVAVSFTNFGPYHLARLRALAGALGRSGGRLIAYETAGTQGLYPWETPRASEPFEWVTLFPDRVLEDLPRRACARAMSEALGRDRPDAVVACGYSRPESSAMLAWARGQGRPAVLMSESQAIDHPRVWWKEAVKRRRVRKFSSALVGGPRHRDYLVTLGMPSGRIALGYNAVDGDAFAAAASAFRQDHGGRSGLPARPYFLAVSRFAPEKNLSALVEAYSRYRREARDPSSAWDLVLCGDGPAAAGVEAEVAASGFAGSIHRPGFLQAGALARWYAFASAFVHPSLMEPWGLVVNEAAACGLPLLVSERAGCVETFVPDAGATTGRRFDPRDVKALADALEWVAGLPEAERRSLGGRAAAVARAWGPERFASGAIEALRIGAGTGQLLPEGRRELVPIG